MPLPSLQRRIHGVSRGSCAPAAFTGRVLAIGSGHRAAEEKRLHRDPPAIPPTFLTGVRSAEQGGLAGARDGQRLGRRVPGDRRAGADGRALAAGTGATRCPCIEPMKRGRRSRSGLVDAIVVAGDGARADVHVAAMVASADIRQVVHLDPSRDLGLLDLDEVADVRRARRGACPAGSRETARPGLSAPR